MCPGQPDLRHSAFYFWLLPRAWSKWKASFWHYSLYWSPVLNSINLVAHNFKFLHNIYPMDYLKQTWLMLCDLCLVEVLNWNHHLFVLEAHHQSSDLSVHLVSLADRVSGLKRSDERVLSAQGYSKLYCFCSFSWIMHATESNFDKISWKTYLVILWPGNVDFLDS